MRYGIDLDGVLVDYIPHFVKEMHKLCAVIPEGFVPRTWDWWRGFGLSKDQWDMLCHEIWNQPNFWCKLPPYQEMVEILRKHVTTYLNDEIFFITSRPQIASDSILDQTHDWLDQHGLRQFNTSVILAKNSKSKPIIYEMCEIDRAIDDNLHTVLDSSSRTFLMLRNWNKYDLLNVEINLQTITTPNEFAEKFLGD